jgi:uncharacterized membrane protein YkoI
MRLSRTLLFGLVCGLGIVGTAPLAAAEQSCLSPEERRAVIAARKAVPLARAMHLVKTKVPGEVVKVRLCRQDREDAGTKGLVYVLTVLARSGKVLQARVDAADGHWLGGS